MFKLKIALVLLGLLGYQLYGQDETPAQIPLGVVYSDSSSVYAFSYPYNDTSIFSSQNVIEVRITKNSFRNQTVYLFSYNSGCWSGIIYFTFQKNKEKRDTTIQLNSIEVASLMAFFVKHRIFSLPDQDSLPNDRLFYDSNLNTIVGEGFGVGCGNHYRVTYKVGNLFRSYSFGNSESFQYEFPEFIEYMHMAEIEKKLDALIPY